MGSQTAWGPGRARQGALPGVVFRTYRRRRHPRLKLLFRGSIPSPRFPLSTLRRAPHGALRMTRGQRRWLILHCKTLSFSTSNQFGRRTGSSKHPLGPRAHAFASAPQRCNHRFARPRRVCRSQLGAAGEGARNDFVRGRLAAGGVLGLLPTVCRWPSSPAPASHSPAFRRERSTPQVPEPQTVGGPRRRALRAPTRFHA